MLKVLGQCWPPFLANVPETKPCTPISFPCLTGCSAFCSLHCAPCLICCCGPCPLSDRLHATCRGYLCLACSRLHPLRLCHQPARQCSKYYLPSSRSWSTGQPSRKNIWDEVVQSDGHCPSKKGVWVLVPAPNGFSVPGL